MLENMRRIDILIQRQDGEFQLLHDGLGEFELSEEAVMRLQEQIVEAAIEWLSAGAHPGSVSQVHLDDDCPLAVSFRLGEPN